LNDDGISNVKLSDRIKASNVKLIDQHLDDLLYGRVTELREIEDFAGQLHIHPTHLSNTIKALPSTSPCGT
jgi:AraC family transcriptional regulator of adaptative response / methylphosphotriester-DNA alkyltransferase methyltransferase